jgi:hypothetical protein
MTKAFRVEEQVKQLSAALRAGSYGPPSFYTQLESKGIDWRRSALLDSVQEQGRCLCGKLIDHRRRLFEFEIDFSGSGGDPTQWGEVDQVGRWNERDLTGEWWKADRPRGTQPRPNDPITIGLTLIGEREG